MTARGHKGPARGSLVLTLLVIPALVGSATVSTALLGFSVSSVVRHGAAPGEALANDTTRPDISITSPTAGTVFRTFEISVGGIASDDVAVEEVRLSTDGERWYEAEGTTAWTSTALLREGTTTIFARAFDHRGNNATASVAVVLDIEPARTAARVLASVGILVMVVGAVAIWLAGRRPLPPGP